MKEKDLREPVKNWLQAQGLTVLFEVRLLGAYCDMVGVKFAPRVGRRIPAIQLLVAVELKLKYVTGVLSQATANRLIVHKSYAAMPTRRVMRMLPKTLRRFYKAEIGLLSVNDVAREYIIAEENNEPEFIEQTKRKLWRRVRVIKDY